MRGVDDLSGPAPCFVVAYGAAPLYIVVCGKALTHFPLAELEAVPQDVAERFSRRTACIARELFEAPLLSRTQYERTHGRKSITGLGDVAERPAHGIWPDLLTSRALETCCAAVRPNTAPRRTDVAPV